MDKHGTWGSGRIQTMPLSSRNGEYWKGSFLPSSQTEDPTPRRGRHVVGLVDGASKSGAKAGNVVARMLCIACGVRDAGPGLVLHVMSCGW